jgi:hypothetical protein
MVLGINFLPNQRKFWKYIWLKLPVFVQWVLTNQNHWVYAASSRNETYFYIQSNIDEIHKFCTDIVENQMTLSLMTQWGGTNSNQFFISHKDCHNLRKITLVLVFFFHFYEKTKFWGRSIKVLFVRREKWLWNILQHSLQAPVGGQTAEVYNNVGLSFAGRGDHSKTKTAFDYFRATFVHAQIYAAAAHYRPPRAKFRRNHDAEFSGAYRDCFHHECEGPPECWPPRRPSCRNYDVAELCKPSDRPKSALLLQIGSSQRGAIYCTGR